MARSPLLLVFVLGLIFIVVAGKDSAALDKAKKPPKPPKIVKCSGPKKLYPYCKNVKFPCPPSCDRSCKVDCARCRPVCLCDKPGGVCQDPRFIGGDGITFYFHGKKDRDFCLLSDSDLHINAHFIGKRDANMTRDFTWVQSIAVLFGRHQLFLGAQRTTAWDDDNDRLMVSLDGVPVILPAGDGARWQSAVGPALTVSRSGATNAVTVEVDGKIRISATVVPITEEESRVHNYGITSEDCFAHLELEFKFFSLSNDVHGVLGQTYKNGYVSPVSVTANMPVMGGEEKFASSNLYATDCKVARFGSGAMDIAMVSEPTKVICASGISGRGIVCKK